jgi:hypothetical protein
MLARNVIVDYQCHQHKKQYMRMLGRKGKSWSEVPLLKKSGRICLTTPFLRLIHPGKDYFL